MALMTSRIIGKRIYDTEIGYRAISRTTTRQLELIFPIIGLEGQANGLIQDSLSREPLTKDILHNIEQLNFLGVLESKSPSRPSQTESITGLSRSSELGLGRMTQQSGIQLSRRQLWFNQGVTRVSGRVQSWRS